MTLVVTEKFVDVEGYKYNTYYFCSDADGKYQIMIRDCSQDEICNYAVGDEIVIYGEGAGEKEVYDAQYNVKTGICINVAYIEIVQ